MAVKEWMEQDELYEGVKWRRTCIAVVSSACAALLALKLFVMVFGGLYVVTLSGEPVHAIVALIDCVLVGSILIASILLLAMSLNHWDPKERRVGQMNVAWAFDALYAVLLAMGALCIAVGGALAGVSTFAECRVLVTGAECAVSLRNWASVLFATEGVRLIIVCTAGVLLLLLFFLWKPNKHRESWGEAVMTEK